MFKIPELLVEFKLPASIVDCRPPRLEATRFFAISSSLPVTGVAVGAGVGGELGLPPPDILLTSYLFYFLL